MTATLPTGTIASRLAASGNGFDTDRSDFDMLNAALDATGLRTALANPGADLTLLAPTDSAFITLARTLGYRGSSEGDALQAILTTLGTLAPGGDPLPLLTDILRYHVLPDAKTRGEIAAETSLATLLPGATLNPFGSTIGDADPDAADPRLLGATTITGNGTLQAISGVLLPLNLAGNADPAAPPTIAGVVDASGTGFDSNAADFDILKAALGAAGLTAALDNPAADLTVFAPTDGAFLELARTLGYAGQAEQGAFDAIVAALTTLSPGGDPIPLLRDILEYHVAGERLSRDQADAAGPIATLNGATIEVAGNRIVDADPDLRDARFVAGGSDILAANGAVQVIDRVLLPIDLDTAGNAVGGSIADQIARSGTGFDSNRNDFDMLKAALEVTGLTAALDDPAANVTLFAPTDGAFITLARNLGYGGTDEQGALDAIVQALAGLNPEGDPIPVLTGVLTYHLTQGSLTLADIARSAEIDTLFGSALTPFNRTLIDADVTLPDARLIGTSADLEASNGTIQAINRVLLPIDLPEVSGSQRPHGTLADTIDRTGNGFDNNRADFDILEAALGAAGLTAALDNPDASLTLLAPTDAAFVRLAERFGFTGSSEAGAFDTIVEALTGLGGGDPIPLLGDILSYHVLDGQFSRQQLAASGTAETLLGDALGFRGTQIIDAEPGYAVRFAGPTNQLTDNGALHAIDNVLLPLNLDVI